MTAIQLINEELKTSRDLFNGTIEGVLQEHLMVKPGGKALPVGAIIAHAIICEDLIVNGMLRKIAPIGDSTFENMTGIDIPMPSMDENWSIAHEKWANTVKIDLAMINKYKDSVFESTDIYITSLKDSDLDQEVELGSWGKMKVSYILYSMIINHLNSLSGEISALKGLQNLKGYPF